MRNPVDVETLKRRLDDRLVVASVSGGKDSAAMCLFLREIGIPFQPIFLDTAWEHPDTYAYLRGPLTAALGPIKEIRGPLDMEALILAKGMFPSRVRRFCTQELKVFPMQAHLAALVKGGADTVNCVGIRAAESAARAAMTEWEWSDGFDCEVWRPLLRWSEQDVIDIHRRHGLVPNPLYLQGAKRVGCWPCINARKEEVRLMAQMDPARIDRIRALESAVAARAAERHARDAAAWARDPDPRPAPEDYEDCDEHEAALVRWEQKKRRLESPFSPPAWFQARIAEGPGGGFPCWPIDKVVEWSRTSRGGKQFELFAPAGPSGCVRWGLCDTGGADE